MYNCERLSASIVPKKQRGEKMDKILAYYTKRAEILSIIPEDEIIAAQNRLASISFSDADFLNRMNVRA